MTTGQLILVGAPAAGKTTVGALVAQRLQVPFTDTDERLVDALGLTLPEAWATLPAERITQTEIAVCQDVLDRPGIIALGSQAVGSAGIRTALAGRNVVWLRVSATQITRRSGMGSLGMETLTPLRRQLDALLQQREPWYEEVASVQLETDRLNPAMVADQVGQAWEGAA